MDTIFNDIQIIIDTMDENDINYVISRKLLEYLHNEIRELSITTLAEECYTSPATITRYTKSLGFRNFVDLKSALLDNKKFLREMINDNYKGLIFNDGNEYKEFFQYTESIKSSLDDLVNVINFKDIDNLIEDIYEAKDIYIFGMQLSGSFSFYLQYMLMSYGKMVHFAFTRNQESKFTENVKEDDLCIFISVDGNYFNARKYIFEEIRKNNTKMYVITQNPNNRILTNFDHVVYVGNYQNGRSSNYKFLLFIEVLLNRYLNRYIL